MDIKQLNRLAAACKRHGITRIKTADVELQFDHHLTERTKPHSPLTNEEPTKQDPTFTEEDALFWSAGPS